MYCIGWYLVEGTSESILFNQNRRTYSLHSILLHFLLPFLLDTHCSVIAWMLYSIQLLIVQQTLKGKNKEYFLGFQISTSILEFSQNPRFLNARPLWPSISKLLGKPSGSKCKRYQISLMHPDASAEQRVVLVYLFYM